MREKSDVVAGVLLAVFMAFLLIFGARYHTIENAASAEMDGYVAKADLLRAGEIPLDKYHPLLYPLLASAAGRLLGGSFVGARAVSTICAAMLGLFVYLIARSMLARRAALFVLALTLLNCYTMTVAMDTTTDMTFAAFLVATLYFLMRFIERPRAALVVAGAVFFALAYFTRYSALFLVPTVLVAVLASRRGGFARRLGDLALFVGAAAVVLIPHFILMAKAFGSPFYNENWKNLAFKLHGDNDWTYFGRMPYTSLVEVIASSPVKFIALALREIAKFFFITLSDMGGRGLAAAIFAAGALAGGYVFLCSWSRAKLVLCSFCLVFIILGCAFFFSSPRLMLPIMPMCNLFIGAFVFSGALPGARAIGRLRITGTAAAVGIVLLVTTLNTGEYVKSYVRAEPRAELEAARAIERDHGSDVTVLGTFPFMQRYVHCRYEVLETPRDGEKECPERYLRRLAEMLREANADYVIIGRLTLGGRPEALLEGNAVPDCLELLTRNGDVAVYRVRCK